MPMEGSSTEGAGNEKGRTMNKRDGDSQPTKTFTSDDIPSFKKLSSENSATKTGRGGCEKPRPGSCDEDEKAGEEKSSPTERNGNFDTPEDLLSGDDFVVRNDTSPASSMDEFGRSRNDRSDAAGMALEAAKLAEKEAFGEEKEVKPYRIPRKNEKAKSSVLPAKQPFASPFQPHPRKSPILRSVLVEPPRCDPRSPVGRPENAKNGQATSPARKEAVSSAVKNTDETDSVAQIVKDSRKNAENTSEPKIAAQKSNERDDGIKMVNVWVNGKQLTFKEHMKLEEERAAAKTKAITDEIRRNAPMVREKRRKKALRKAMRDAEIADFNGNKMDEWKKRGGPPGCQEKPRNEARDAQIGRPVAAVGWRERIPPPRGDRCAEERRFDRGPLHSRREDRGRHEDHPRDRPFPPHRPLPPPRRSDASFVHDGPNRCRAPTPPRYRRDRSPSPSRHRLGRSPTPPRYRRYPSPPPPRYRRDRTPSPPRHRRDLVPSPRYRDDFQRRPRGYGERAASPPQEAFRSPRYRGPHGRSPLRRYEGNPIVQRARSLSPTPVRMRSPPRRRGQGPSLDLERVPKEPRPQRSPVGKVSEKRRVRHRRTRKSRRDRYSESESDSESESESESESDAESDSPVRKRGNKRRTKRRYAETSSSSSDSEEERQRRRKKRKKEKKRRSKRKEKKRRQETSSESDEQSGSEQEEEKRERPSAGLVSARAMHRRYRRRKEIRPLGTVEKVIDKHKLDPRRGDKSFVKAFGERPKTLTETEYRTARKVMADLMKQRGTEVDKIANQAVDDMRMPSWYEGAEPVQDIVNIFADLGNDGFLPFLYKLVETEEKMENVWKKSVPLVALKFKELGMTNFKRVALTVDDLFRNHEVAKAVQLVNAARKQLKAVIVLMDTPAMHEYFMQYSIEDASSVGRLYVGHGSSKRSPRRD